MLLMSTNRNITNQTSGIHLLGLRLISLIITLLILWTQLSIPNGTTGPNILVKPLVSNCLHLKVLRGGCLLQPAAVAGLLSKTDWPLARRFTYVSGVEGQASLLLVFQADTTQTLKKSMIMNPEAYGGCAITGSHMAVALITVDNAPFFYRNCNNALLETHFAESIE